VTLVATPQRTIADPDELRRNELSAFLRSRRERLTPLQAGLPAGGRRRTPGLRREEVAQLAGVGVTWYTWLEQGRDIKVSTQVLEAISRTLMLGRDERAHLYTLAGSSDAPVSSECAELTPAVRSMLEKFMPFPACVQDGKYDLLAWNPAYARLISNIDALAPEDRNCMWLLFTDPAWRKCVVDWDESARRMVAQLRAQMAEHVAEPAWKAHLRRLHAASPEFSDLWERHEVSAIVTKAKRIRNPYIGRLNFEAVSTWLNPRPGVRLLVYTPTDAETVRRLEQLVEILQADVA
jgi:transcriptional regulator with XRE-family HTH domain